MIDMLRFPDSLRPSPADKKIIALEGVDASGKSTLCVELERKYSNCKFIKIPEIYVTPPLKDYLWTKASTIGNALIYMASLVDRKSMMDALHDDSIEYLITDRSLWSTVVVDYVHHPEYTQSVIDAFASISAFLPIPNKILILDVPYQICRNRIMQRSADVKKYDTMSETEYQKHISFYHWLEANDIGVSMIPYAGLTDITSSAELLYQTMQEKN